MAVQKKGRALIIKRRTSTGPDVYTTVCGMKARSVTINNNPVDVSVPDCVAPEGVVYAAQAAGVQAWQFTGSGLYDDDANWAAVINDVATQVFDTYYQIVIPGIGTVTGPFCVDGLSFSGSEQGNMEFEGTWRSNGAVTWAAEA